MLNSLHRSLSAQAAVASQLDAALSSMSSNDMDAPQLPPVWSALVYATEEINGASLHPSFHTEAKLLFQDDTKQQEVTIDKQKISFAPISFVGTPLEWLNITQYATTQIFALNLNGQTLDGTAAYGAHYNSLFKWVPYAKPGPSVTINHTRLQTWQLQTATASLSVAIDAGGQPRRFEENATVSSGANSSYIYHLKYDFETFRTNDTSTLWDTFVPTDYTKPKSCQHSEASSKSAATTTTRMYIFHPRANFNITQQDLASITGDTLFVCIEGSSKGGHDYEWISEYEVTHVSNFGQYQNCNGYPSKCIGDEHFYVGHEAGMALGPSDAHARAAGQCTENPLVGEWYSLPFGGKCAEGHTPGDGTCSWYALRVKTIDSACLFRPAAGFFAACKADGRAPYASAAKLFALAFQKDAPAEGGCPALPGP